MKRAASAAIGAIAAITVYLLTQGVFRDVMHGSEDQTSREFLNRVANEVNKNCPMMVNSETELMNTVGQDGVIVYNYRLVNTSAGDVSPNVLLEGLRGPVTQHVCSTPETRENLLDEGITMRFSYHDRSKTFIGSLDVSSDDCE